MLLALLALCTLFISPSTSGSEGDGANGSSPLIFYVDANTGNDDTCSNLSRPRAADVPCASLEAVAKMARTLTGMEIVIQSPTLTVKEPVKFEDLSMLRIIGAQTSRIQCSPENSGNETSGNSTAGVVFVAIVNLQIMDLTFEQCGTFYNYPAGCETFYIRSFRAALHVYNCTNIQVRSVTVSWSNGAGMAVSGVHAGTFNISDSWFEQNMIPEADEDSYTGGGGIYARVCLHFSKYVITNCTFTNNTASTTGTFVYSDIFGSIVRGRGLGGGLQVNVLGDASNNTVKIDRCHFFQNTAFFGGGLGMGILQRSMNNFAVISNSFFEENGCYGSESTRSKGGGGLHLGYNSYSYGEKGERVRDNTMVIEDSIFTRNCRSGTVFYSSRSDANVNNRIVFNNCSWIDNPGSAVKLIPHTEERLSNGFLPIPVFTNCKFINNRAPPTVKGPQRASMLGVLFSSQLNIKFTSSVLFKGNTNTALVVVNGLADFSLCNATFANNTGVYGGAISLVGLSSMVIGSGHEYQFLHNTATDRGGAINSYLIDENDFTASRSCFIQYSDLTVHPSQWSCRLNFLGNEAPIGKSIFTTAINPCLLSTLLLNSSSDTNEFDVADRGKVFRWPGVFFYDEPTENQIASDGAEFQIVGKLPFEIIPGKIHSLQLNVTDDLGQPAVDAVLRAMIYDKQNTDVVVDEGFSYVEDKQVQLNGDVGETGVLVLQFVNPRQTSVHIDFVLVQCPVGFALTEESKCTCDINSYQGFTECDTNSLETYIRQGFWTGYVEDSLVTAVCPVGFCHYNNYSGTTSIPLPRTSSNSELDSSICGPFRTGILCGDCKEGYSVYYHSPFFTCQKNQLCNIGWLFFILSELTPATVLFIVVLLLNIRFTSGKLNGFIFFSQILSTLFINATDVVDIPDSVHILSQGYRIIYGFFSLDFFTIEPLSFCLWEGASVLDVLAFKYVTVVYSLILVILVIIFMKYFAWRLLGNRLKISAIQISVIHGISAFFIMCYMQCIDVSLKILLSQQLRGRGHLLSPARVWFSGETEVFSPEHLPYAIPALFCLLTLGIIPPILLLAYPLNYKVAALLNINDQTCPRLTRLTRMISLNKLKPILDSFQGSFKDNFRFFAGLYCIYRWVGLLSYAMSPDLSVFYVILQAMLTVMLLVHAVVHPYKKRWYNVIDAFLLTDLTLINLLTSFNYYYTLVNAEDVKDQQVIKGTSSVQLILIYLPILVMCIYLTVVSIRRCCLQKTRTADSYETRGLFTPSNISCTSATVTTTEIEPPEEFPARLLTEYNLQSEDAERFYSSSGLPPNIPPAYDAL